MPLPTAQVYLIAFLDHNPISNAKDEREDGIGGCSIYLYDFSGGQLAVDAFGNPLGTTYRTDIFGEPLLNPDGAPIVDQVGAGVPAQSGQIDSLLSVPRREGKQKFFYNPRQTCQG